MKLTQEAIEKAYGELSTKDRANIESQSLLLQVKLSDSTKVFGHLQALELLAKLGVWMVKNE